MYNLDLHTINLEEVIKLLEVDNNNICSTIKNIADAIKKMDDSVWKSPEKNNIEQQLLPYLEKNEKKYLQSFRESIDVLNKALLSYQEQDQNLKSRAEKLSNLDNIEVLNV